MGRASRSKRELKELRESSKREKVCSSVPKQRAHDNSPQEYSQDRYRKKGLMAIKRAWKIIATTISVIVVIISFSSVYSQYLSFSAPIRITPVELAIIDNPTALTFRVENPYIVPIRQVEGDVMMKYVEDDHHNRFMNVIQRILIKEKIPAHDYVEQVFGLIKSGQIISGEVAVVVRYKFPIITKQFSDEKVFRAIRQENGRVRWIAY